MDKEKEEQRDDGPELTEEDERLLDLVWLVHVARLQVIAAEEEAE